MRHHACSFAAAWGNELPRWWAIVVLQFADALIAFEPIWFHPVALLIANTVRQTIAAIA
jgi:hypothetical protein